MLDLIETQSACLIFCSKDIETIKLCEYVFEDVKDVYFVRQWRYLGNDKWIYSVALGIALGKKNFCMPWMPTMDYQEYRNSLIINAMKKVNGKVLFPLGEVKEFRFIDKQDIVIKHFNNSM